MRSFRGCTDLEGFGLAVGVTGGKSINRFDRSPIRGDGEIARKLRRVNRLFQKIVFFLGLPCGPDLRMVKASDRPRAGTFKDIAPVAMPCPRRARLRRWCASVMTLPNQLTILRLLLTAIFVMARESSMAWGATIAAVSFAAAVLSDYLDGVLARRMRCETDFGRLMDPLADKVLIAAALVCLVASHDIQAWAAVVLISRDFLITGLRQLALSNGIVLAADPAGKTKTASQMVMIGFFLLRDAAGNWFPTEEWHQPSGMIFILGRVLVYASVILSIHSGWRYARAHWNVVVRSGRGS